MTPILSPLDLVRTPSPEAYAVQPPQPLPEIDEAVFALFNELIKAKWNGRFACVYQDEVQAAADAVGIEMDEPKWCVEPHYRRMGWKVSYKRPAYYGNDDVFRHFYVFSHEGVTPEEMRSCYQYG